MASLVIALSKRMFVLEKLKLTLSGIKLGGDLDEIVAQGPKFCPKLGSGRSGSLPKKKKDEI